MNKCERCGTTNSFLQSFYAVFLCYKCIELIIKEWDIKRKEVNYLGQGRNACKLKDCTYEIDHLGKHSYE